MNITSLSTPKKFPTLVVYILAAVGIGLIVYFGKDLIQDVQNLGGKSQLKADNIYQEAEVYLDNDLLGKTPYESKEIKAGEHKVTVKTADRQYEATLNFAPNTQVVVKRDLGISENFSSGQNYWIEKTNSQTVLSITSEPTGASIFIDNTEVGKTPFSSSTLTAGEYDLRVESPQYEGQSARIKIQKGYNLNIAVKLFPTPAPAKIIAFEGSANLFDASSSNSIVTADVQNWARALVYWNKTRGVNLADLGVNKEPVFDFFVDFKGDLYAKDGQVISTAAQDEQLKGVVRGAYLGRTSDGAGLTNEAKEAYLNLSTKTLGKMAKIIETGTGWLRVRDTAGLGGIEVAKVNVGTEYSVLEEQTEWVKIKVSDTLEGWVSKTYVDITE